MRFLGWTFIWKKQIRNISYQFGCGTQPLRSCFQFWNWKKSTIKRSKLKSKVFSRLIRVRRIRWAIQFFPPNNFGIFPKLKLYFPNEISLKNFQRFMSKSSIGSFNLKETLEYIGVSFSSIPQGGFKMNADKIW